MHRPVGQDTRHKHYFMGAHQSPSMGFFSLFFSAMLNAHVHVIGALKLLGNREVRAVLGARGGVPRLEVMALLRVMS